MANLLIRTFRTFDTLNHETLKEKVEHFINGGGVKI